MGRGSAGCALRQAASKPARSIRAPPALEPMTGGYPTKETVNGEAAEGERMSRLWWVAALLVGPVCHAQTVHVAPAPAGNDANDGLSEAGPVATLGHAVERLRQIKPGASGPLMVSIADGTYILTEPLVLGREDSAPVGSTLTFRAARDNGDGLISGGRTLGPAWASRPFLRGRLYSLTVDPLSDGRLFRD